MTQTFKAGWGIRRRDVLKGAVALGVAGALGPAITSARARAASSTVYLYGVQQTTGKVYQIDVANGDATMVVDLTSIASGLGIPFSASSPNSNAYDVDENRFYFTSFGGTAKLYSVDLDDASPSITLAGTLNGAAASGTITVDGDGKAFYYVENGTDDLKRVALASDGTAGAETKVADLAGGARMNFGDIAFSRDGLLYISADRNGTPFNGTYDVGTGTLSEFSGLSPADKFQISFAQDDTLYLHQTGTGKFFALDESGPSLDEVSWSTTLGTDEETLTLTDLTGNKLLATCEECDEEGMLAKYEVESYEMEEEEMAYHFVLDGGSDGYVTPVSGSMIDEPLSATFTTDYCDLYAVVKAGSFAEVQHVVADEDGQVTIYGIDEEKSNKSGKEWIVTHAISHVQFYCDEQTAIDAANALHGVKIVV